MTLYNLFRLIDRFAQRASAHCDIPCGIYDPHLAQMAAHTVYRMTTLIRDLKVPPPEKTPAQRAEYVSTIVRYTATKEEHAELCKKELRVLWGDFFKPEHVEKFPELHDLVWKTLKLASKARQETNVENAKELIQSVNKIAEIFWKCKGIETMTVKAPYPTEEPFVVPKLK